ncbi:hypothetical protein [Massilia varians]|uniref:hypothetical protein n=1 Tax=Massilia varians TaxID=457921 RepID=UPI00255217A6|nr:hypothetical protein [Massilia varians]MDK6076529.1 hypothetical protein [Massilia varians]
MKSTFKFASAMLLMASSAAFAAPQTTAHPGAQPAAAAHATAPAPAPAKADMKAEKHRIATDEKTALASCKTMKGAEKSACRKDAIAKASAARAHLKAGKHA